MSEASTQFGYRSSAQEVLAGLDFSGKSVMVTGGYSGIGFETSKAFALAGAHVHVVGRDLVKAQAAAQKISALPGAGELTAGQIDLSDLTQIKSFVADFSAANSSLDVLINNAGVMVTPESVTAQGFEMQFGTNHLGHFALTVGLLPLLLETQSPRIVCLSSTGHRLSGVNFDDPFFKQRPYDKWLAYGQSKTANALFAIGLQQRYADRGLDAFSVHPGGIMTNLQRHMPQQEIEGFGWVSADGEVNERFKTMEQGASTSAWAASSPELTGKGGCYLEDCQIALPAEPAAGAPSGVYAHATDEQAAQRLWQLSEQWTEITAA